MMDKLEKDFTDLIESALALTMSLEQNLKEDGKISPETVVIMNDFKAKHDKLGHLLDLVTGIQ